MEGEVGVGVEVEGGLGLVREGGFIGEGVWVLV